MPTYLGDHLGRARGARLWSPRYGGYPFHKRTQLRKVSNLGMRVLNIELFHQKLTSSFK
jgi:hypothetical protein